MSTISILIVLPLLIIFSYLFDAFARKTKFPAVILLIFTGVLLRAIISIFGIGDISFLDNLIPVLGTIGLILIVLEGALELSIKKEKLPIILKGFFAALIILLLNIAALNFVFQHILSMDSQAAIIFAIPLSIISSAVAIPSASGLLSHDKEFVVYESTFSDILGIMLFNYAIKQFQNNEPLISSSSIVALLLQIIGVVVISIIITYALFRLLQNIKHNVKFFLILALLILVYAIGKIFHLPALVTIFIFGLFLSNIKNLLPSFLLRYLDINQTEKELEEFHILTAESTFLVKTFFFLFFGFSIGLDQFTSVFPFLYGIIILFVMFVNRYAYLSITTRKKHSSPLVYISPRGLISILLFLQIKDLDFLTVPEIPSIDERVLLIVILSSMLVMIIGAFKKSTKEENVLQKEEETNLEGYTTQSIEDKENETFI